MSGEGLPPMVTVQATFGWTGIPIFIKIIEIGAIGLYTNLLKNIRE